jgi:hypothetical protein
VRYVPVEIGAVRPNDEMRIRLTDDAAVRLAREFGRISSQIEGNVGPRGVDSMEVAVWVGRDYAGTQFSTVRQTVSLARAEVTDLSRRQFSIGRTVLASSVGIALFVALVDQVFLQEDPNPTRNDDIPPPPAGGIIRLRIPFGLAR